MNAEQQSSAPEDQPPAPTPGAPAEVSAGRTRGNPLALGRSLLVLLLLCGLLPTAVLAWWDWGRRQQLSSNLESQSRRQAELAKLLGSVDRQLQDIVNKWRRTESELRRQLHLAQGKLAASRLVAKLLALVATKKTDEIVADKKLAGLMKNPPPPLQKMVLLDRQAERLLAESPGLTSSDRQQALAPPATASSRSSWRTEALPGSGLELVYQLQHPPAPPELSVPRLAAPPVPKVPAATATGHPGDWAVLASIAVLAVLFSLVVYFWHRKRLLRPLARLVGLVRQLGNDPAAADLAALSPSRPLLLPDLAPALERLRERLQHLQQLQLAGQQRQQDIDILQEYLGNMAAGRFVGPPRLSSTDLQPLSLAAGQLADRLGGRLEALVMAAGRIQQHARELAELSGQMEIVLPTPAESDHSTLADLLSVQLDALCQAVDRLATGDLENGKLPPAEEDSDKQRAELKTLSSGLLEYCHGLARSGRDIQRVHEKARLLATNLAVVAGAQSPAAIAGLKDKVSEMGELLDGLASVLPERLVELAGLAEKLQQRLQRLDQTITREHGQLQLLRDKLSGRDDNIIAMKNQTTVIRPLAGPLGNNYRQMTRQVAEMRNNMNQLNDNLARTSRVAASLAEAVQALTGEISQLHPDLPAPAVVSHELVRTQHTLEMAVKHIEQLATAQGIQSLSPRASEILQHIHEVAEKARRSVVSSSNTGDGGRSD